MEILIYFKDIIENKLADKEVLGNDTIKQWNDDLCQIKQLIEDRKISYTELMNLNEVYVIYDKSDSVWMSHDSLSDGIETVKKDSSNVISLVDTKKSSLTDVERYIEIGGIEIFTI